MSEPIKKIRHKDGTHAYRFVTDTGRNPETGKRRQITVTRPTKTEAKNELSRIRSQVDQGTYIAPTDMTVDEWLDIYLADATIDVEKKTAASYTDCLKPVRQFLGTQEVQRLCEKDIDDLVEWMLTSARRRGGTPGTGLGARSVQLTLGRLRAALVLAVRRQVVGRNVAEYTKIPRWAWKERTAKQKAARPWDEREIAVFLDHVSGHRLHAPVLLALMGVGPAELCGQRWREDVDLTAKTIRAGDNTRTLVFSEGRTEVVEKDGKTAARSRLLPLPDEVVAALRAFRQRQAAEQQAAGESYEYSGYLLVDELGRPFKTDKWRRELYKLMRQAGVRQVRPYLARHACLTYLGAHGVPDVVVSAWAGHADLSIAKRVYIHPTAQHLQPAATHLGSLFRGGSATPTASDAPVQSGRPSVSRRAAALRQATRQPVTRTGTTGRARNNAPQSDVRSM